MILYECPTDDFTCPYFQSANDVENGFCTLENPYNECDEFYMAYGDLEEKEDYDDFN